MRVEMLHALEFFTRVSHPWPLAELVATAAVEREGAKIGFLTANELSRLSYPPGPAETGTGPDLGSKRRKRPNIPI